MIKPYEIKSLQPGFLFITYDPAVIEPSELTDIGISREEFIRLGYTGGIIVPEGTTFDTLDDKLMADLGWVRIKNG